MAKHARDNLEWQFGEEVWQEPESQTSSTRRPSRFPWYLLVLAAVAACLLWWIGVPFTVPPPQTTPPVIAARATASPGGLPPTAPPTAEPRAMPGARIYMTNLSEQGNRGVVIYNPLTGSTLRKLATADWPQIAVSPDGSKLFIADILPSAADPRSGRLRIFDARTWELLVMTPLNDRQRPFRNFGPPALAVAPNGESLFVQRLIGDTFRIDRFDTRSGISDDVPASGVFYLAAVQPCAQVRFVFPSADDRWLYEVCTSGVLYFDDRVRHSTTHTVALVEPADSPAATLSGAAMAADFSALYGVTPRGLVVQVDLQLGRVVTRVQLPLLTSQTVISYQVTASGTPATLVLGLSRGDQAEPDLATEVWFVNTQTWQVQNQWVTQTPFAGLAVSPDEQWLVTNNPVEQTLTVYNLTSGEVIRTLSDTGISWSPVVAARAPPEPATPSPQAATERLYVLDAGDETTPPALLGLDPRSARVQLYPLPDLLIGRTPDVALSRDGRRIWVLQEGESPGVSRLLLLDAGDGRLLSSVMVDDALPPAAGGDGPPRIVAGLDDNLLLQRALGGRFPVWLDNYLSGPAGIRRQVEPPYWYSTPLCGPSHLLWRIRTQRLLVLCQAAGAPPVLSEAQVVLFGARSVKRLALTDTPSANTAVLAPDESLLYVLGTGPTITPVDLDVFTTTAAIYPIYLETFNTPGRPVGRPVVSRDGRTLYSALAYAPNSSAARTLGTLWAMDTETWIVKARLALAQIAGGQAAAYNAIDLGLSYDGQRLYALDSLASSVLVVDTTRNVIVRGIETGAVNPVRLLVAPAPE